MTDTEKNQAEAQYSADSIQVLEHGHIIEQGSRQQLLDAGGV